MTSSKWSILLTLMTLAGCSTRTVNLASSRGTDDAGVDAMVPDAQIERDGGQPTRPEIDGGQAYCDGVLCPCSNGLDDDGDQLIDAEDPECTGPTDRYEDSLAMGVHGESQNTKCQDCFYDQNSGSGDDGCNRPRACATDPNAVSSGACSSCAVASKCEQSCAQLAPNGCDCFGCCGVWRDGVAKNVLLRSTCTVSQLDDSDACPPCVPAADCLNPCGTCELCTGRPASDLPASCTGGTGPGFTCDEATVCVDSRDCGADQICQLGCCVIFAI